MNTIEQLQSEMKQLERNLSLAAQNRQELISGLHLSQQESATNLIQYLALRNEDIRLLQDRLHHAGLSSLSSSESHILRQVQSVRKLLGESINEESISTLDYYTAQNALNKRTTDLFGEKNDPAIPHIMVTLDTTFADNKDLIRALLVAGMNVARINCAHGDEKNWKSLIRLVQKECESLDCECAIYMDIAGPKMRVYFPGKGNEEGKLKLALSQEILLVEPYEKVNKKTKAISCHEQGVISSLKEGERVIIDDGKFEGMVKYKKGKCYLTITRISSTKSYLKKDKGFNLPDTLLEVPILSDADLKAAKFIAKNADLVGCSFLRNPTDLKIIKDTFKKLGKSPKLILKIETPEAVLNMPALLLEAMTEENFGVMIARGDLAVEIGFERLSEIQDEILWICEAANTPVIWATQVLETFSKSGIATRSEVTDAAHAAKAECVMLNKGDFIIETIALLKNILNKSGGHRQKKRYTMRPLAIASHFLHQTKESRIS